jgi:hypothetical protein
MKRYPLWIPTECFRTVFVIMDCDALNFSEWEVGVTYWFQRESGSHEAARDPVTIANL